MIGKTVSHYRIIEKLGAGGMGEVYLAQDLSLGRKVALKFLRPDAREDGRARKRLLYEARAAAALDDPFICKVYEVGEAERGKYIAMEFVDGRTLKSILAEGSMAPTALLNTAVEIAEALKVAHDRGVIHRDLKPANIMLGPTGHAKVLDFGLARRVETPGGGPLQDATESALTVAGEIVGTVDYMSPEQLCGENADARSDIYAMGVTLVESLTGHHPFRRASVPETISAILTGERLPATVGPDPDSGLLHDIASKAMARKAADRYQRVDDLLSDLRHVIADGTKASRVATEPETPVAAAGGGHPLRRWVQTKRRSMVAVTSSVCVLVVAVVFWQLNRPALSFSARDWVLISEFDNRTGDAALDRSLGTALTVSLSQSRYANVFPASRLGPVLKRMGKSTDVRVDELIGLEVCQREGIRGLICPSISKVGSRFLLTARLVDPSTGSAVRSYSEAAEGYSQVLPALDRIAGTVRKSLGESLQEVAKANRPLDKVTTSSLQALEWYSEARVLWRKAQHQAALELQKSAVGLDADFAMAHSALGTYLCSTIFNNTREGKGHYEKAIALSARLTERERQTIRLEYESHFGTPGSTRGLYQAFLSAYPDATTQRYNYAFFLDSQGEPKEAAEQYREVLRVAPDDASARLNLAICLKDLRQMPEALTTFKSAFDLEPAWLANDGLNGTYGFTLLIAGDETAAREVFAKNGSKAGSLRSLALVDLLHGKFRAGGDKLQEAVSVNAAANQTLSEARNHLFLSMVSDALGDRSRSRRELDIASSRLDSVSPVIWLRSRIGVSYARTGHPDRAGLMLAKLQREMNPNNSEHNSNLHLLSGEIELARGDAMKALEFLRIAEKEQRIIFTTQALARVNESLRRKAEAVTLYERVLNDPERFGHEGQFRWLETHMRLANLYFDAGQGEKARAVLQNLLTLWKEADTDLAMMRDARQLSDRLSKKNM